MRKQICLILVLTFILAFPLIAEADYENSVMPPAIFDSGERALPAAFDWRDKDSKNYISPVKNQGSCGACWAFGAVAVIEACANIFLDDVAHQSWNMDLSEQYVVSCNAGGSCATGGFAQTTMDSAQNTGIPPETCYPYIAAEGDCANKCADWESKVIKIAKTGTVAIPTVDTVKKMIMESGPVTSSMNGGGTFQSWDETGIYTGQTTACATTDFTHLITIVGWDDADETWICKNSWGDSWADSGFFKIKRGTGCVATISVEWVLMDPVSIPGTNLTVGLDADTKTYNVDVPKTGEKKFTVTIKRTGSDIALPWEVELPKPTPDWVYRLDFSPAEGVIAKGATTADIEITIKADEMRRADTSDDTVKIVTLYTGTAVEINIKGTKVEPVVDGDEEAETVVDGDTTTPADGDTTVPEDGDTTQPEDGDTTVPEDGDTAQPEDGDTTPTEDGDTAPTEDGDATPTEDGESTPTEDGDTAQPADGDATEETADGDTGSTTDDDDGSGGLCQSVYTPSYFEMIILFAAIALLIRRKRSEA